MSFDHCADICSSYALIIPTRVHRYDIAHGNTPLFALVTQL